MIDQILVLIASIIAVQTIIYWYLDAAHQTMEQDSSTNIPSEADVIDILTIETPQRPRLECVPGTSHLSSRPSEVRIVSQSPCQEHRLCPALSTSWFASKCDAYNTF